MEELDECRDGIGDTIGIGIGDTIGIGIGDTIGIGIGDTIGIGIGDTIGIGIGATFCFGILIQRFVIGFNTLPSGHSLGFLGSFFLGSFFLGSLGSGGGGVIRRGEGFGSSNTLLSRRIIGTPKLFALSTLPLLSFKSATTR